LHQWREAKCRQAAADGEAWIVWVVPVTMDKLTAYAAFHWDYGAAPEDPPVLDGIFESLDEAKAAFMADGYVDGWHSANYFFTIIVIIRYDTAATAHWTLMFIVRAFIKYTITVAVWTRFSFHGDPTLTDLPQRFEISVNKPLRRCNGF
jgi:hypothetical protein